MSHKEREEVYGVNTKLRQLKFSVELSLYMAEELKTKAV